MTMERYSWYLCCLAAILLLAILDRPSAQALACSCELQHPQIHYCKADFAIIARVQKRVKGQDSYSTVYKLKIRKAYKLSPKAKVALESGRLLTAAEDSMCGVQLKLHQTYLITGSIHNLQAHVNLCNFFQPWKQITPRQRKGFRLLYQRGCSCKIQNGPPTLRRPPHVCYSASRNCLSDFGICLMKRSGRCDWARSQVLTQCLSGTGTTLRDLRRP